MKKARGLPKLKKLENVMCKQCQLGKITKSSFKRKKYTSIDLLELVHTNLCGHINVKIYYGDKYFVLSIDDYSKMIAMMFLKDKSR